MGDILVTAQKRTEKIRDVPMAISVLSGADLDSSTARMSDTLNRIPSVSAIVESSATTLLTIRGVSAGSGFLNGASPIGFYLDGMPFGLTRSALSPNLNAYDLDRVEVLRGPQGTLYGASAQNGVVRILTKDPDLANFEAKARANVSTTRKGGESYRGDVAINVPIISDKLAARLVVGYEDWSGWIDHPNKKNVNDETIKNIRLKIKAQPTERLSFGLSTWLWRDKMGAPSVGTDNYTHPALVEEPQSFKYDTYAFNTTYDFDSFSIKNVFSYLDYTSLRINDLQSSRNLANTLLYNGLDSRVYSNEFNIGSTSPGPWQWTAGGIYRDAKDHFYQYRRQYANPLGNRFSDGSKSYAVFGQLSRKFADDKLELAAGLRYFEDHVTSREISRLSDPNANPLIVSKGKFDALSPRVVLTWHPDKEILTYASYSEGFRSGFPQAPYLNLPNFPPVDADNLHNYEVGTKISFLDGHAELEGAVFYIDWKDIQQQITVQLLVVGVPTNFLATVNGPAASGPGAEIGITTRPARGLSLGASVSWSDLTMDADVLSGTTLLFRKGDRLVNSPKYTAAVSGEYSFDLAAGLKASLAGSANYVSKRQIRGLLAGVSSIETGDNMLTAQASFGVRSDAGWAATLFVDNLTDENGSPNADFNPIPNNHVRIQPRTIGLQLEYKFQ